MRARPGPHPPREPRPRPRVAPRRSRSPRSGVPARAHSFTKTDGNDTPGKLDIRSVVRRATPRPGSSQVPDLRELDAGEPPERLLPPGPDRQEQRPHATSGALHLLRGRLRRCSPTAGRPSSRYLPVGKLERDHREDRSRSRRPGSCTGGRPPPGGRDRAPCGNGCVDFLPNFFPDLLHDLMPPDVTMATRRSGSGRSRRRRRVRFPFTATDQHSGIESWTVQRHPTSSRSWTNVAPDGRGLPRTR